MGEERLFRRRYAELCWGYGRGGWCGVEGNDGEGECGVGQRFLDEVVKEGFTDIVSGGKGGVVLDIQDT